MTTAGCGDGRAGGVNWPEVAMRARQQPSIPLAKGTPRRANVFARIGASGKSTRWCRISDYAGLGASISRRGRHSNRQSETSVTGRSRKHPIASLHGQLLAPPSFESLTLQCEAYPMHPTSSLRSLNGKACRQGVFSTTGSWVFKAGILSLLIWS
jgi:hypothetical protein